MANPAAHSNRRIVKICQDLTDNHHAYLRKFGPRLLWRHQDHWGQPEIKTIKILLSDVLQELTPHLLREEVLVFPYCQRLALATDPFQVKSQAMAETLCALENEHHHWGYKIQEVEGLLGKIASPLTEQPEFLAWKNQLEQFINIFKQLIYTENEILFPQVMALENALFGH